MSDEVAKTITIAWNAPQDNGGCRILGYEIFMNDGTPDSTVLSTQVIAMANNNPSILTYTIDLSITGVVGYIYKFKIRALNIVGSVDSSAVSVALASLPAQPTQVPVSIP